MQSILATGGTFQQRKEYIENQLDQLSISKFDRIFLHAENSVKIEQIRYLIRELHKKPFGESTPGVKTSGVSREAPYRPDVHRDWYWGSGSPDVESLKSPLRAGIILAAEKATIEAQNALLKLLEEPPKSAYLFLSAPNPRHLVATIASRCKNVRVVHAAHLLDKQTDDELKKIFTIIFSLKKDKIGKRLEQAEILSKNRQNTDQFLQNALLYIRQQYLQKSKSTPGVSDEHRTPPGVNNSESLKYVIIARKLILSRQLISANVNPRQVLENLFLEL